MFDIQLKYNDGYSWTSDGQIYVKGIAFNSRGELLQGNSLIAHFKQTEIQSALLDLNGIFAVVIIENAAVIAATDRLRTFPLFYKIENHKLWISDDARLSIPLVKNENAANMLENFGYVVGNETLFRDVYQIGAGQYLTFKELTVTIKTWHHFPSRKAEHTENEWKTLLKACLVHVGKRMMEMLGDSPVALPLSGGFDSRLIGLLLKTNGHRNTFCFTFGNPHHKEAITSKIIAGRLGFPWKFIDYKPYTQEKYIHAQPFCEYVDYMGNGTTFPYLQEYFAARFFKGTSLPQNTVFLPGYSGDFLAGSHLLPDMKYIHSNEEACRKLYRKHGRQLPYSAAGKKRILSYISESFELEQHGWPHWAFDKWNFQQRQAKQIINSARVWSFMGYRYLIPLWDNELVDFFSALPFEYRLYKKLYDAVLKEWFAENGILLEDEKQTHRFQAKVNFLKVRMKELFPDLYRINRLDHASFFYSNQLFEPMFQELKPFEYKNGNAVLSAWYIKQVFHE